MATSGTSATAPQERTSPTPSSEGPMTHALEGRRAPQAAAKGAIRSSSAAPTAIGRQVRKPGQLLSVREGRRQRGSRVRSQRFVGIHVGWRARGTAGLGTSRGRWLVRRVDVPLVRYGMPAYGLYRVVLLQVLAKRGQRCRPADRAAGHRGGSARLEWRVRLPTDRRTGQLATRPAVPGPAAPTMGIEYAQGHGREDR